MNNKSSIFLFTKDRPEVFKRTLRNLSPVVYRIFIVDDSCHHSNRNENEKIALKNGCVYLGAKSFQNFMIAHKIAPDISSFLLSPPGTAEWNLGYMRNFALLYSKALKLETVLFMDDDITVTDKHLIDELFGLTRDYLFAGANISGMIDDSILGHIATTLGKPSDRTLSGGFMAFCPEKVEHYFLNNYNEDWIWLFLHFAPENSIQTGEVFQAVSDPLKNYKQTGIFQEFGERLLEAVMVSCRRGEHTFLTSMAFWAFIIKERNDYLADLRTEAIHLNREDFVSVIDFIKENSTDFDAKTLHHIFHNYFLNLQTFQKISQSFYE